MATGEYASADEHLAEHRQKRDPVASADPAPELRAKKAARRTEDAHELQSFRELLAELATRCRHTCEFGNVESPLRVTKLTDPTPLGCEAFRLLERARRQPASFRIPLRIDSIVPGTLETCPTAISRQLFLARS